MDLNKIVAKSVELKLIDGSIVRGKVLTRDIAEKLDIYNFDYPFGGKYFFRTEDGNYVRLSAHGINRVVGTHGPLRQQTRAYSLKIETYDSDKKGRIIESYPSQFALISWPLKSGAQVLEMVNINSPHTIKKLDLMQRYGNGRPQLVYSEKAPEGVLTGPGGLIKALVQNQA